MFIKEADDRLGITLSVKIPATEYYLERWEARKIHEALGEIISGWDHNQQGVSADLCKVCGRGVEANHTECLQRTTTGH